MNFQFKNISINRKVHTHMYYFYNVHGPFNILKMQFSMYFYGFWDRTLSRNENQAHVSQAFFISSWNHEYYCVLAEILITGWRQGYKKL